VARDTVTLVTGDQVTVDTFSDGRQAVTPKPGPGRTGISFAETRRDGKVTVVPSDALALLGRGLLDPALFDVSGLLSQGYSDRGTPELPLIVGYTAGDRATLAPSARASVAHTADAGRDLPSIHGQAVHERKKDAGEFWRTVAAPASAPQAAKSDLAPGLTRIWLDARVQASLDKSVPQIGAPDAWRAGYTGAGVKTAVLDTGIDSTHPDVKDAVAAAQDFTGSPNGTVDGNGHGTHVASIITGNGAASGGKYVGVAPDTQLLVGKVLDDSGTGSASQIIAGMEWAVAQHARIVSMSLGAHGGSDGSDPMSQAVQALSTSSGTLFVIAAGNDGSAPGTVSAPSVADAALSVGAVDSADQIASFSSRGPRQGDHAVKPEITAPGVDITAARAAGTSRGTPVGDYYTRLSGTSMATPHVAGAAAILAQEHPDWNGQQLKDALMSSAKPTPGLGVFDQGTGRVDVAAAFQRTAYASPAAVSTYLAWPHTAPVTRTVTYHNDADTPLVLALAVTGDAGLPARPAAPSVTVPAHGTADVPVSIDPAATQPGTHSGVLTATGPDGTVLVRTALGVYDEPESYDVRIDAVDRDGTHLAGGAVALTNIDTGADTRLSVDGDVLKARVPKGHYSIDAMIRTPDGNGHAASWTLATRPEVVVGADTSVVVDARAGLPANLTVDQPDTVSTTRWLMAVQQFGGRGWEISAFMADPATEAYAVPATVSGRPYAYRLSNFLTQAPQGDKPGRAYNLAQSHDGGIPADPSTRVKTADLAVVDVRTHSQAQSGSLPGGISRLAGWNGEGSYSGGFHDLQVPSTWKEYFSTAPTLVWEGIEQTDTTFEVAAPTSYSTTRKTVEDWNEAAVTPLAGFGRCGDTGNASFAPFSTSATGHVLSYYGPSSGHISLLRDGQVIGSADGTDFATVDGLAADKATYTLRLEAQRDTPTNVLGSRIDASWTFSSAHPTTTDGCDNARLLAARISGDFDAENRAPADRPIPLTVRFDASDGSRTQVKAFTLEASFDGGTTWLRLPALPDGQGYTAIAPPPLRGGDGYVALRTTVQDTQGNALDQTILRAYRIAGR
jgi:subtilisin family serine protease